MTSELVKAESHAKVIEEVVIGGDLAKLSPEQRVAYYQSVCHVMGIQWELRPFNYITLNSKLTLYATKNATDQLRKRDEISIVDMKADISDSWIVVTVTAKDKNGRTDTDIGAVSQKDMNSSYGNCYKKAVTQAKRRVTLSICGMGMLDESEVDQIPNAHVVNVDLDTGEIIDAEPAGTNPDPIDDKAWRSWIKLNEEALNLGMEAVNANRDRITKDELRDLYRELRASIEAHKSGNGNADQKELI